MSTPPPVRPRSAQQEPQRRRRRVRLLPLAVAAWVVLEIWLFVLVAEATSGWVVFLCIVAGFVLGAAAVKRAGRSAWRNLTAQVQGQQAAWSARGPAGPGGPGGADAGAAGGPEGAGAHPAAEAPAGGGRTGLHMLGGLLLIIPGFVSDAIGLVLLLPPTRRLVGAAVQRAAERHVRRHPVPDAGPGSLGDLFQQARQAEEQARMHRPDGKVIQGEVVDRD